MGIGRTFPTIERLKSLLVYDPETGEWRWVSGRGRVKKGDIAGTRRSDGYIVIRIDGGQHLAHRLAWFWMTEEIPPEIIDHKDRDRSNGRWDNLRAATPSQNAGNSGLPKHNTSGVRGVTWAKQSGKWAAHIKKNNRQVNLGLFVNIQDASAAYGRAANEHFGEFVPS